MSISVNSQDHRVVLRKREAQEDAAASPAAAPAAGPAGSSLDASGAKAPVNSLAALLGSFDSANGGEAAATASTPQKTDAAADASEAAQPTRPNIDALNRVLAHYAAQSAAANLPFVIVDD